MTGTGITVVTHPLEEIGVATAKMILARIEDSDFIPPSVIVPFKEGCCARLRGLFPCNSDLHLDPGDISGCDNHTVTMCDHGRGFGARKTNSEAPLRCCVLTRSTSDT